MIEFVQLNDRVKQKYEKTNVKRNFKIHIKLNALK